MAISLSMVFDLSTNWVYEMSLAGMQETAVTQIAVAIARDVT